MPRALVTDLTRERLKAVAPLSVDMRHQHDPEIIDCRKCGAQFDLARQLYYTDLCPSCEDSRTGSS